MVKICVHVNIRGGSGDEPLVTHIAVIEGGRRRLIVIAEQIAVRELQVINSVTQIILSGEKRRVPGGGADRRRFGGTGRGRSAARDGRLIDDLRRAFIVTVIAGLLELVGIPSVTVTGPAVETPDPPFDAVNV
jgi:hypothetical protein